MLDVRVGSKLLDKSNIFKIARKKIYKVNFKKDRDISFLAKKLISLKKKDHVLL